MKKDLTVEPIQNGFLVHITKEKPEGWTPDGEQKEPDRFMGMVIEPKDTWYAKSPEDVLALIREKYFEL